MEFTTNQFGYNLNFVSTVSEEFRCLLCKLVLRNAILVKKCGHRFCSPCFGRLKVYSENIGRPLICPIDRDHINLNNIVTDDVINSSINCLHIQCNNNNQCRWTGELKDLSLHQVRCDFSTTQEVMSKEKSILEVLDERMNQYEEELLIKGKDIALLKFMFKEQLPRVSQRLEKIEILEHQNSEREMKLKLLDNAIKKNEVFMKEIRRNQISLKENFETMDDHLRLLEKQYYLSIKRAEKMEKSLETWIAEVKHVISQSDDNWNEGVKLYLAVKNFRSSLEEHQHEISHVKKSVKLNALNVRDVKNKTTVNENNILKMERKVKVLKKKWKDQNSLMSSVARDVGHVVTSNKQNQSVVQQDQQGYTGIYTKPVNSSQMNDELGTIRSGVTRVSQLIDDMVVESSEMTSNFIPKNMKIYDQVDGCHNESLIQERIDILSKELELKIEKNISELRRSVYLSLDKQSYEMTKMIKLFMKKNKYKVASNKGVLHKNSKYNKASNSATNLSTRMRNKSVSVFRTS